MRTSRAIIISSVALNVALAAIILRTPSEQESRTVASAPSALEVPAVINPAVSATQAQLEVPEVGSEPDRILSMMRRSGASSQALVKVARALLSDEYSAKRIAAGGRTCTYAWERLAAPRLSAEQRAEVDRLLEEEEAKVKSLVGEDTYASASIGSLVNDPYLGKIPPDKLARFVEIQRDYAKTVGVAMRNSSGSSAEKEMALINSEREADLRALFSPEEYAAYQLKNSEVARPYAEAFAGMPVTDEQFAAVVTASRDAKSTTDRAAVVRSMLGDEAAVSYVMLAEPRFSPTLLALKSAGVADTELLRVRAEFDRRGGKTPMDFRVQVVAGMTPEQVATFDASPLGVRIAKDIEYVLSRKGPGL